MSTSAALRGRQAIAFWLVAAACLLTSHDLVYLVQLGPGRGLVDTLRSAGHGYWPLLSGLIVAAAILLVVRTALRLRALGRQARGLKGHGSPARIGQFLRLWIRLLVVVAAAFLVQENAEHFVNHAHAPLLGALGGPEYPLALPLLAGITFIGAVGTLLVRERERTLLARIAGAVPHFRRAAEPAMRPGSSVVRHPALLSRPDLSRGPPLSA